MASVGFRAKDAKTLSELASLLQCKGDKVLSGECKLSLTTQSLGLLHHMFEAEGHNRNEDFLRRRNNQEQEHLRRDVLFLQDFLQKTLFVKIIHRSSTIQGAVKIGFFTSLKRLEIKKVPIHLIEGLQRLRSQLKSITCTRCVTQLQDLLETCGGDMSTAMSWASLQEICLSYNSILNLDSSLRLLPVLEAFDISHNNLEELDNHLQYLTELVHINLGYNQISVVPQFSLSVRTKLNTLILRNNKLEHLEGVEDLINLQELDVTNNCLYDHACLDVLNTLDNLDLLCLLGNPLAYHASHRSLTVQHLSPIAAKEKFVLDGKKLSEAEKMLTVRHHVHRSPSRRPTQLVHALISDTQQIANQYTFSDSDPIAQSLPVALPTGKKRTKIRAKGRTRKALITEFESSTDTTTGVSSQDSSRGEGHPSKSSHKSQADSSQAPSPQPKQKAQEQVNSKEQFEVMREHYGPDWLRAFNNNPEEATKVSSLSNPPGYTTEDDIYLNDSETGVESMSHNPAREVEAGVGKVSVFDKEGTVEENGNDLDKTDGSGPGRLDSEHGIEWQRTDSEQYEYYGDESEPFIVMLDDSEQSQLFLSLNERYLLEKDVNGTLKEMLDLKLLEAMDCTTERRVVGGMEEGVLMPVVRLTFGYVRKDRRERMYIMEDETNAEEFQALLQPVVEAKQLKEKLKPQLHCLKCSADFVKSQAKVVIKNTDQVTGDDTMSSSPAASNTNALYEAYSCPKCGSEMVVEMELPLTELASSAKSTTPAGSLPKSLDARPLDTSSPLKPVKQSTTQDGSNNNSPKVVFTIGSFENKDLHHVISSQKRASLPAIMPTTPVISPIVRSPRIAPVYSKTSGVGWLQNGHSVGREAEVSTGVGGTGLKRETRVASWSDFRSRQNSTGSDIAILSNPSEGSVYTLTDSGQRDVTGGEEERARTSLLVGRTVSPILEKIVCTEEVASDLRATENGEENVDRLANGQGTDPIQSPLSLSVCNSMVSSVYENSINSAPPHTDLLSDLVNASLPSNEADGDLSIYDSPGKAVTKQQSIEPIPDNDSGMDVKNPASVSDNTSTLTGHPSDSSSFLVDSYSASLTDCNGDSREDQGIPPAKSNKNVPSVTEEKRHGCDTDFTELDHRLKLHFHMSLLKESEECVCMIQCDVAQYMMKEEFPGILLLTSENFYILKILRDVKRKKESEPKSWLRCIEAQPHSELQHVDMGLGKQSFRLEFDTDCSSYTFIVRDRGRCQTFLQLVKDYLESRGCDSVDLSLKDDDPVTIENLYQQILIGSDELDGEGALEAGESSQPFNYVTGYLVKESEQMPVGLVVTDTDIYMIIENHQWPLPRLQAPLSPDIKGSQFTLIQRQNINNVIQIQYCAEDAMKVTLCFYDEESGEELEWCVSMETANGVQSLVKWIKDPWEAEFGVDLEVSSVSLQT